MTVRDLYLERHGPPEGRVVVLLHHGLGAAPAWRRQVPGLVAAGRRVLLYDRRGYGRSPAVDALDLPAFERDVTELTELLEQEGVARSVLVGHSDGGTIALLYAARYPERVQGLVTVAAHIYVEPRMEAGLVEISRRWTEDTFFRQGLERLHGEQAGTLLEQWLSGWQRPEHRAWDIRPRLAAVTSPVLVIQGEEDEHALPEHAVALAEALPDGRLRLIPGGRHMFPQEEPERFNPLLLDFLAALPD
jgi:pimeloyl-ACP methyl ester carboxylesterase